MEAKGNNPELSVTVVIPSLNPDEKLKQVVDGLIENGFTDIIVVNDGSDEEHLEPFNSIKEYPQCTLLVHDINMGKGRALKDAFLYVCGNRENISGVVTVDADNQHGISDIISCCRELVKNKDKVILGVRDFSENDVPWRSRFGNSMTSLVFRFACGLRISDTQTGLRAIPYKYLESFSKIKGERYEYETNMLLELKAHDIDYVQVKIKTIYIDENETSHFHPIKDSIKIYKVIFAFIFSSAAASVIDIAAFAIISFIIGDKLPRELKVLIATVGARIISSFVNYNVNRKAVFKSKASVKSSIIRYYVLCVCQMFVSYGLVYLASEVMTLGNWLTTLVKAVIDTVLFFISFRIQKLWVFRQ